MKYLLVFVLLLVFSCSISADSTDDYREWLDIELDLLVQTQELTQIAIHTEEGVDNYWGQDNSGSKVYVLPIDGKVFSVVFESFYYDGIAYESGRTEFKNVSKRFIDARYYANSDYGLAQIIAIKNGLKIIFNFGMGSLPSDFSFEGELNENLAVEYFSSLLLKRIALYSNE